jgi:hypothetical protein
MTIHQHAVFDPETIEIMSTAYEGVCEALNLADRTNPLTYLVAKKIIELAQRGERDPDQMRQQALKAFGRSG